MTRRVLALAAVLLPRRVRSRWREEIEADLLQLPPRRRMSYLLDVLVKLPKLAAAHGSGRPTSALAGLWLLTGVLAVVVGLVGAFGVGEDAAEFFFLMAPCGMAPAVAISVARAVRRSGSGWWGVPAVIAGTFLAGTGPVPAGLLGLAAGALWPDGGPGVGALTMLGAVGPGTWLVAVSVPGLRAHRATAVLGVLAGAALLVMTGAFRLTLLADGSGPLLAVPMLASLAVFVPAFLSWSVLLSWQLLSGRSELLGPRAARL